MKKLLKIGTRNSELALWQATTVKKKLEDLGYSSVLVPIKTTGDTILDTPLYEFGVTGIFTKALDVALLEGRIDIAVHSMKDVPTLLPKGIVQTAVLERAAVHDILIYKNSSLIPDIATIATGSLRRKAQWLAKYPSHTVVNLRGNVNTRLKKLKTNDWYAAIFAKAGLSRIELLPENHLVLDWMIPAPAQGAIMVAARENDVYAKEVSNKINHTQTQFCATIERDFLRTLEGGCTAPIGAYAYFDKEILYFKGILLSLDGTKKTSIEKQVNHTNKEAVGVQWGKEALANGGQEIMSLLKNKV